MIRSDLSTRKRKAKQLDDMIVEEYSRSFGYPASGLGSLTPPPVKYSNHPTPQTVRMTFLDQPSASKLRGVVNPVKQSVKQ